MGPSGHAIVAPESQLRAGVAQRALDAAISRAKSIGEAVAVAIVDESGWPAALTRMDGASPPSAKAAMDKAQTAALFRCPSDQALGASSCIPEGIWLAFDLSGAQFCGAPGGLPISGAEGFRGAVGVHGGSAENQVACALAAVAAVGSVSLT